MDMNEIVDIVHDAEASGLLDDSTVDYTASPWKLKDTFKMHIVSVQEFPSGEFIAFYDGPTIILDGRKHVTVIDGIEYRLEDYEPVEYRHFPLAKFKDYVKKRKIRKAIAHNGIGYDLLAYKAYFGLNYTIQEEGDTWADKDVEHVDTMVLSKTLNPDRQGGHSLENVAKAAGGVQKKEFRYHMPSDERFKHFAADMLHYNIFDLQSNKSVYDYLMKEQGNHDWSNAITTEKCTADLITRQAHRGFAFNVELAEKNVKELDAMMQEARIKVEPILPPKQATKGFMKDFTPPKNQYKKDGSLSHHMEKFIEKLQAKKIETEGKVSAIEFQGKVYQLPLEEGKSLVTEVPATLDDTTHIKEWLVSLGWSPSEYKEKDLTLKTGTKIKLTPEEYAKVVDKYVEQTLNSSFMEDRCEFLECTPRTLKTKLLSVKNGRGMRVRTNPSFTKGQDKEMCANLEAMGEKFPFATDIVKYLTYKHRRNSILGGGADWDDDEDAEKGFISAVRADGRIPTPADTCGAATSRMKHRLVANISRVTSLYGEPMRSMFTADPENCYQIGYDFASLEAVIESHYCHKYETPTEKGVREYCESLLQEKPNDVHTKMAEKISSIIGRKFERSNAKAVKYGCTYGAQAAKVAKTIGSDLKVGQQVFDAFWEAAAPLKKLKDALQKHWESNDKKYILTIDNRKVPTRAAHAILNSLFQSAGVICAKKAMIIWERKLRENGLNVDFWTEDWKNKLWAQQMIAYHDEAQIEVSKKLVKFKMFSTKEEVNAFRKEQYESQGLIWAEAHESPKGGWFTAYSLPGQLVVEAVKETTEFYKLNCPLSADYVLGTSWANCH